MTAIASMFRLALLALAATTTGLQAQGQVSQFADLNTGLNPGANGSLGSSAISFDGRRFFVATTDRLGSELWVTDGSAINTRIFADICPGSCASSPSNFYVEGSNLFFSADDGQHGAELWRLAAGSNVPVLVSDINPGAPSSTPASFTRLSFRINASTVTRTFFVARTGEHGREIWRLNAGASPTVALERDVNPGPGSSEPTSFALLNTLDIAVICRPIGLEREVLALQYTSTTAPASGTSELSGFGTDTQRFADPTMITLGPNTYVVIRDFTTFNSELWVTQGTVPSTIKLRTANSISGLTFNVALFRVFFVSGSGASSVLAVTDGSVAGTSNITSAGVTPQNLVSLGNRLLFTGVATGSGRELFSSDGTLAGTGLLKEVVAGATGITETTFLRPTVSQTRALLAFDDKLWISDGTNAGTTLISGSAIQGGGTMTVLVATTANEAIIGYSADGQSSGEPFYTTGTAASTVALGNLQSDIGDSFSVPVTAFNNRLIFSGFVPGQSGNNFSLPTSGTGVPEALGSFTAAASGVHFGRVWFRGSNGLVATDGTAAGTVTLSPARPEIRGPQCVIERNGARYFIASGNGSNDVEIYRSDGTTPNTFPVTDLSTPDSISVWDLCFDGFVGIAGAAGRLYFIGFEPATGMELRSLDGSDQLGLVADIRAGADDSDIFNMIALNDRLLFVANDGIFGAELWVTTGTAQGTSRLTDISPGPLSSSITNLRRVGDRIVFTAISPTHGNELYASDGTAAGTQRISDLVSGVGSAFGEYVPVFAEGNGRLYFRATSSIEPACRLFETDGTAAGTHCAYNPASVTLGPVQSIVVAANGAVVFTATRSSPDDGEEIRVLYNGALVAVPGADVAAGPEGSAPQRLLAAGDVVYFQANDGFSGRELWQIQLPDLDLVFRQGFE